MEWMWKKQIKVILQISCPPIDAIHTVNYYDHYEFAEKANFIGNGNNKRVRGMLSGTMERVLDSNSEK